MKEKLNKMHEPKVLLYCWS